MSEEETSPSHDEPGPEHHDSKPLEGYRRRDLAKAVAGLGGVAAVGSLAAPIVGLTRVFERSFTGPLYEDGTYLVDEAGNRITDGALEFGQRITVFPETNPSVDDAPTLLVRYPETEYAEPTNLAFTVSGYAAYSKVCTHAGCMVDDSEDGTLVCPCHFAKYDPREGAAVVGGPAPRALPQLPITVSSDGFLVATGNFEGSIGPGGE